MTNSPPDPSGSCGDLFLYSTFHSDTDGGNTLASTHATFWTMWTPPNNGLDNRYLSGYPVVFSQRSPSDIVANVPQIGIALETYHNTSTGNTYSSHYKTTTVNPSPAIGGTYELGWGVATSGFLGYAVTYCQNSPSNLLACDANGAQGMVRIEECWSGATADDYLLQVDTNGTTGSCPSTWTHFRTVGWLYRKPQAFPTNPVYSCEHSTTYHYSSNDPACGGDTVIGLLGYALAN